MLVIAEGVVHMLSPNENKVLCVLKSGAYFIESGMYTSSRILLSFVASTFCLVYHLDKDDLKEVLSGFPYIDFEFEDFGRFKYRVKLTFTS